MKINWECAARERVKSGHALFGASGIERTMLCPGWVRLGVENNSLESKDTEFSLEGQLAHALAHRCFRFETPAASFVKKKFQVLRPNGNLTYVIQEEMAVEIQKYVDWCNELPGVHFVETRVDLSRFSPIPYQFGSADHGAIYLEPDTLDEYTLVVTDLKYGMEPVYVERLPQVMDYGIGFLEDFGMLYNITKVILRICQPRLNYFGVWETTPQEILAFGKTVYAAIEVAIAPDPPFQAGEKQCRWCPMSGKCAVEKKYLSELMSGEFDSFDERQQGDIQALTMEELETCYENEDFVRHWLKATRMRLMEMISSGVKSRYKIVEGMEGHRRWVDEEKTAQFLMKGGVDVLDLYDTKIISPAQAEKLLPKKVRVKVNQYVSRPPGKPIIVPVADPRRPYTPILDEFEDFDDNDIGV